MNVARTWSSARLSAPLLELKVATVGNMALVYDHRYNQRATPGSGFLDADLIDIYDTDAAP